MSDQGFESTLIENISFSNIMIDRDYYLPIRIEISEHNRCTAIRNIYFNGIHARAAWMPHITGRPDCTVQNIFLTDCHFTQIPYEAIDTKFAARMVKLGTQLKYPTFRNVVNLVMNSTVFSLL